MNAARRVAAAHHTGDPVRLRRWECRCTPTPFLLGVVDASGRVNIKLRDRYLRVTLGTVETICPKCGCHHRFGPDGPERDPAGSDLPD